MSSSAAMAAAPFQMAGTSRDRLFFWVFLILSANGVSGLVIRSWTGALSSTFEVSALVWIAGTAGLALLWQSTDTQRASSKDMALVAVASAIALLPIANVSTVTMTAFATYAICTGNSATACRRAGAIFLAITANLIWGRLLLGLFSRKLLFIDAFFVSNVIGSTQVGNTIQFIGQPGRILVAPGCSSLQGISLAIVCWVTVNQWFAAPIGIRSLMWCGLAILTAFAINIIRLAALVYFPSHFDQIHTGWGAQVFSFSMMLSLIVVTVWGARREIFR